MVLLLKATVEWAILRMLMAAYAIAAEFAKIHGHWGAEYQRTNPRELRAWASSSTSCWTVSIRHLLCSSSELIFCTVLLMKCVNRAS